MILTFKPYLKSVLWGGDKITRLKRLPVQDGIGESWELSGVPGHESVVANGPFKDQSLSQLCAHMGERLLGRWGAKASQFPLLIKLIDARRDLSVQVHPDEQLAQKRHHCHGKTEMWYVIDHEHDAKIYSGLAAPLTPDELATRVADHSIMQVVGTHPSQAGQVYYIPSGTIHSIGAGNLVAEIQQASDITYRIYDYDRRDANGNPRELHTHLAAEAINYRYPNDIEPTAQVFSDGDALRCPYFTTNVLKGDAGKSLTLTPDGNTFIIVMCVKGAARLDTDADSCPLLAGQTALVTADSPQVTLRYDNDENIVLITTLTQPA